jgi:uncharacterized membrane protein
MSQWHYAENGQQLGQVSEEELHRLAAQGRIKPETLVWTAGMADWAPYKDAAARGALAPQPGQPAAAATGSGNTPNRELMAAARKSLSGFWGPAIGVCIVPSAISVVCSMIPVIGQIVAFVITGAFSIGSATYFINLSRHNNPSFGMVFSGFKRFWPALGAVILTSVFVMLWFLLLVIPGIIASYRYSMTFYIMADNPTIGAMDAIRASGRMMKGRKMKLFFLSLRFLGWGILCVFTLGIGLLWLAPYMSTSIAHFYNDVKDR